MKNQEPKKSDLKSKIEVAIVIAAILIGGTVSFLHLHPAPTENDTSTGMVCDKR